ncbi:MAG: tetratricopeptide repeat protein [Bacteroides sp.]|nr:tetratricopeptide repeat protein [Bacteroides sp.]
MTEHNPIFLLICLSLLLALPACRPTTTHIHSPEASPHFYEDSLRTFGRAEQLYSAGKYEEANLCYDSLFILPIADADHPDAMTAEEFRKLAVKTFNSLMVNYNILGEYQQGYNHLDSIERLNHPVISRHARRELWVAKAQILMALNRAAEATDYLNRAMALQGENDDPESEIYCTSVAGITYMGVDTATTHAERAFVRAYEAVKRAGGTRVGCYPMAVGKLGFIYQMQGKYEECIALSREAVEGDTIDTAMQGRLMAAENLMNTYMELGLYDDALRYCSIGTNAKEIEGISNLTSRFFRVKADIYARTNRMDSALYAYDQADSCLAIFNNPDLRDRMRLHRAFCLSMIPDSIRSALHTLSQVVPRISDSYSAYSYCMYGEALVRAKRWDEAVHWLEPGMQKAKMLDLSLCATAAENLADCYQHLGQKDKLTAFFPEYRALRNSIADREKVRQLASANIRFKTEKKEQENRALSAEIELKNASLKTYMAVGAGALMLVLALIGWFVMRHRNLSLHLRLQEQQQEMADERLREQEAQLHRLIASRQELNERNRDLLRQLSDIQAAHENSCDLDRVMESLQDNLLTREEEKHFRSAFSAIYPSALTRLREACPAITRSEELFCMLILLKQTNEEVARTLGISVASVSKTRYRLRLKLELPEGSDVDAEVRKVMRG